VNAGDQRVAILAALFAPQRSSALLARLGTGSEDAIALATRLAAAPRPERLRALADALAADGPALPLPASAVASAERPRVAALIQAIADGREVVRAAPVLVHLCRERLRAGG
jgi:hypothetical protein